MCVTSDDDVRQFVLEYDHDNKYLRGVNYVSANGL